MLFSEKLRFLIEERELTQKKLASDLAIPASTLGGYVQGTSEPDFNTLKQISQYFHVSADYLLGNQNDQTKSFMESELLRVFRTLTPEQQALYLEQGRAIIRFNSKVNAALTAPEVKIEKD